MSTSAPTRLVPDEQFVELSFVGPAELDWEDVGEVTRPDHLTTRELPEFAVSVGELFAGVE
jgi:hypothetical protein